MTIGWGRQDRLCLPIQAKRASAAFPGATMHWFEHSGHFPLWDQPEETIQLVLDATGEPHAGAAATLVQGPAPTQTIRGAAATG